MKGTTLTTLKAFWENNPSYTDAIQPALAWYRHAFKVDWVSPAEVKADFKNAGILKGGRVIINIVDNKYRLVVWINYACSVSAYPFHKHPCLV